MIAKIIRLAREIATPVQYGEFGSITGGANLPLGIELSRAVLKLFTGVSVDDEAELASRAKVRHAEWLGSAPAPTDAPIEPALRAAADQLAIKVCALCATPLELGTPDRPALVFRLHDAAWCAAATKDRIATLTRMYEESRVEEMSARRVVRELIDRQRVQERHLRALMAFLPASATAALAIVKGLLDA